MDSVIDLRSDTITRPTAAMRKAMANADVGDDFYGEDPTISRLEARAAELLGKEAGLLVLSGTMGNLVSVLAQIPNGSSIVVDQTSHVFLNEVGHLASVCGVTARPVAGMRGFPSVEQLRSAAFPDSVLHPPTRMVCIENTHNAAGGRCLDVSATADLAAQARALGMRIHVDGARFFNASVALKVNPAELAGPVDTVTFCLTKGLSAPAGSMICGERDVLEGARRWRQMLGGGMRQAGVFAAAGLVALDTGIARLEEDHANARVLAGALAGHGLSVDPAEVETNMVFAEIPPQLMDAADFVTSLARFGVRINPPKGHRVRFVTHREVDRDDLIRVAERVGQVLDGASIPRSKNAR